MMQPEGILLVDKPEGRTSFSVVAQVRRLSGQKKVGHSGTLDPFATGLLVLLLGKEWTRQANVFMSQTKEYRAVLRLGVCTDTFDRDGSVVELSEYIPTQEQLLEVLGRFQGVIEQTPPMFSAKKVNGQRLYQLARKGIEIERVPCKVEVSLSLIEYSYPYAVIDVVCSKGTYIRSLGHDIGVSLGCFAHLESLRRTRSGSLLVSEALCLEGATKQTIEEHIVKEIL